MVFEALSDGNAEENNRLCVHAEERLRDGHLKIARSVITSNPGPVKMFNVVPGEILRVQDMWGLLNLGDLQTALALTLLFIPLPYVTRYIVVRFQRRGQASEARVSADTECQTLWCDSWPST
jgi:hypothetical protein